MDPNARKVEVFEPFGAAFELTKRILFQPFDVAKWFIIGFAAFLALLGGGGGNFFNFNPADANVKVRSAADEAMNSVESLPVWFVPLLVAVGVVVLTILVICMWLSARGKFIFADCVVRNRGAIVEPWKEYGREGNSYFVFSLAVGAAILLTTAAVSAPIWLPLLRGRGFPEGVLLWVVGTAAAAVFVVIIASWALVSSFMVPIIYRRRCGAIEGCKAAFAAIAEHPGPVILYALFKLVLMMAFAIVSCALTCVTCCVAALPYLGTVILLPAHVFFMSYLLLFVRQFGADYDAWGNLQPDPTALPIDAPPPDRPTGEPPPLPT
jgi:hypothetical protein